MGAVGLDPDNEKKIQRDSFLLEEEETMETEQREEESCKRVAEKKERKRRVRVLTKGDPWR